MLSVTTATEDDSGRVTNKAMIPDLLICIGKQSLCKPHRMQQNVVPCIEYLFRTTRGKPMDIYLSEGNEND